MAPVDAFAAVAEPTRRRLLDVLLDGESSVGELVDRLGSNQPAVSKHLRVLRDAGLVASRVDAQRRRYRLEPAGLRAIDGWIASTAGCGPAASTPSKPTSTRRSGMTNGTVERRGRWITLRYERDYVTHHETGDRVVDRITRLEPPGCSSTPSGST